jgi:hypothetical protein
LHSGHKQGVVGQRAEKLRRHDGKKAAFHCLQARISG